MAELPKYYYFKITTDKLSINIEDASGADVVEVVRCKDCKHLQCDTIFSVNYCGGKRVKDDWFCADGKRRTDDA